MRMYLHIYLPKITQYKFYLPQTILYIWSCAIMSQQKPSTNTLYSSILYCIPIICFQSNFKYVWQAQTEPLDMHKLCKLLAQIPIQLLYSNLLNSQETKFKDWPRHTTTTSNARKLNYGSAYINIPHVPPAQRISFVRMRRSKCNVQILRIIRAAGSFVFDYVMNDLAYVLDRRIDRCAKFT